MGHDARLPARLREPDRPPVDSLLGAGPVAQPAARLAQFAKPSTATVQIDLGGYESVAGRAVRPARIKGVSIDNDALSWIALDGAVNARAVVAGVLLRADNLQSLSAEDVRVLIEQEGLEVVVDLRTDVEVELEGPGPLTAEVGVRIEHRSLYPDSGGNTDLDADTVKPWGAADENESADESPTVRAYMSYLSRRPDSIVGAVRTIARADGAVLVHCAAGKDRTGVVVALALDAAGVDRGRIVDDYLATRQRIDAIMARLVSSPTYRAELEGHDAQRHAPVIGTMERTLELVGERFGGSAAWLSAHGLSDLDLERLRRRLAPLQRAEC